MTAIPVQGCCSIYILLSLVFWGFAVYAYRVNEQLPAEDAQKKDFDPLAIYLTPITWPFILIYYILLGIGFIILFIIEAVLFGIFLILFTLALIFIRKPFILEWLKKIARKIGNKFLEANTALIRMFRNPWPDLSQPF